MKTLTNQMKKIRQYDPLTEETTLAMTYVIKTLEYIDENKNNIHNLDPFSMTEDVIKLVDEFIESYIIQAEYSKEQE